MIQSATKNNISGLIKLNPKQMKTLNLNIKNMVCLRCILVVRNELESLGAFVSTIRIGYATIEAPESVTKRIIAYSLSTYGLELLEDKEEVLIEQIKLAVQQYIKNLENFSIEVTLSDFLAHNLGKNYNFLSKHFSKSEGSTIESYYINKRIDRVKELIKYDELNLSEIAAKLGYSSVHYTSSQFKHVTGLSVTDYKAEVLMENHADKAISVPPLRLREKGYTNKFNMKRRAV
jgi:YesN/AraC family two-component response regulator